MGFSFCIHLDLCCNNKLNFGTSECICNETGSISDYCSEETGKCQCKTGFTGDKCDACATGYRNCMETDACNDYDKMQCDYTKGFIRYPDDTYYDTKFGKDRKGTCHYFALSSYYSFYTVYVHIIDDVMK